MAQVLITLGHVSRLYTRTVFIKNTVNSIQIIVSLCLTIKILYGNFRLRNKMSLFSISPK
jgi:hypothetical protein